MQTTVEMSGLEAKADDGSGRFSGPLVTRSAPLVTVFSNKSTLVFLGVVSGPLEKRADAFTRAL
jgi:hypothetical protein